MLARAISHARRLTLAEWRALAAACVLQVVFRVLLHMWPLPRVVARAVPRSASRPPRVPLEHLRRLVQWSTRLIRGTCLTESLVLRWLAARHGVDVPISIGVSGTRETFRAHAWTGSGGAPGRLTTLWRSTDRRRAR